MIIALDGEVECVLPPVSTPPPVLRNFGIPPAKRPANWGALSIPEDAGCCRSLWSLLLLARRPGAGGARLLGALGAPGTGGAPPRGDGPEPPAALLTMGAERSFVTAFLSAFPLPISESNAPCKWC